MVKFLTIFLFITTSHSRTTSKLLYGLNISCAVIALKRFIYNEEGCVLTIIITLLSFPQFKIQNRKTVHQKNFFFCFAQRPQCLFTAPDLTFTFVQNLFCFNTKIHIFPDCMWCS